MKSKTSGKPAAKPAAKKGDDRRVITPEFRAAFASVWEARAMEGDDNSKEKFSITMLFDEDADLSKLRRAEKAAIKAKWGDKPPRNLRSPFRDAGEHDESLEEGGYKGFKEGMTFVKASTEVQPGVVDQKVQPIVDRKEFYSGCYARASVVAFAYDQRGNKGVSFLLNNVQKLRDGEPLGSSRRAEDDFDEVETDDEDGDDDLAD